MRNNRLSVLLSTAALIAVAAVVTSGGSIAADKATAVDPNTLKTKYPIKHLVVIFNENISFDHYFGTYPNALNVEGEPRFEPKKNTPTDINNLLSSPTLLSSNPNSVNALNAPNQYNPMRLDHSQAASGDQGHSY